MSTANFATIYNIRIFSYKYAVYIVRENYTLGPKFYRFHM